jgi:hypothetical protein
VLLDDVETLSDEGVSTFYGITLAIDTQNILSVVALAGLDLFDSRALSRVAVHFRTRR